MKLYDLSLSGNCYKVRLLAALAGIPLEIVAVDFMAGEHKKPPLIDLNPWGEIPILVDGDVVLRDSQAILVYLAAQYAGEAWLPKDAVGMATVVQWLSPAIEATRSTTSTGCITRLVAPDPNQRGRWWRHGQDT